MGLASLATSGRTDGWTDGRTVGLASLASDGRTDGQTVGLASLASDGLLPRPWRTGCAPLQTVMLYGRSSQRFVMKLYDSGSHRRSCSGSVGASVAERLCPVTNRDSMRRRRSGWSWIDLPIGIRSRRSRMTNGKLGGGRPPDPTSRPGPLTYTTRTLRIRSREKLLNNTVAQGSPEVPGTDLNGPTGDKKP